MFININLFEKCTTIILTLRMTLVFIILLPRVSIKALNKYLEYIVVLVNSYFICFVFMYRPNGYILKTRKDCVISNIYLLILIYIYKIILFQTPKQRSRTVILVKNLPAKTTAAEIRDIFAKFGELGRVVLPPSGLTGM